MLDLSDAPAQSVFPHYDLDDLSAALADCAESWVPRLFPNGRREDDTWRLANIEGASPRKKGSCCINLKGEAPGSWYDHALNTGGGPLSTLAHATGLQGLELLQEAARLADYTPEKQNGRRKGVNADRSGDTPRFAAKAHNLRDPAAKNKSVETEINHILAHTFEPAPDNRVGVYLKTRGLELPKEDASTGDPRWAFGALSRTPTDLLYNPSVTDWKSNPQVGRPCMVGVVRNAAGERIGIHRTYLAWDGAGKADKPLTTEQEGLPAPMQQPRKMMGETQGGAVRLFPVDPAGILGVAEGIETALSVNALFGVPCWAALSAGGLSLWNKPNDIARVVVFADAGEAGEGAAAKLAARYPGTGIALPRSGDDFNTDLVKGLWKEGKTYQCVQNAPETAIIGEVIEAPGVDLKVNSPSPTELAAIINAITKPTTLEALQPVLRLLLPLPAAAQTDNLKSIRSRSGRPIKELQAELTRLSRPPTSWLARVICYENGEPKPILENCAIAFEHDPAWTGVLGYDEFNHRTMLLRPPPWNKLNGHFVERPWDDIDDTAATRWIQRTGVHVPSHMVREAVLAQARENTYHPVRQYLDVNGWDGKPRLDLWLVYYLGVADTPYVRAVGAYFLISAVARIMRPGCQVDSMLILESPKQGIGKSTGLRYLFQPWFADSIAELSSKDAAIELAGKWCIEFADLHRFRTAERNQLKAFLSRVSDHYVPKYGRHAIDQPRQCVFSGTCNEEAYLDDPTGARRFWPVRATSIDLDSLARDRDQLWAEAFARYSAGEKYHLTDETVIEEAGEQQEARQIDDALYVRVRGVVSGNLDISVDEILSALSLTVDKWDRGLQIRVGHALRRMGWVRYRQSKKEGQIKQEWRYRRELS